MSERKCCCSKEPVGTIPILRVIDKVDALLAKDNVEEAGRVLEYWESEARALGDKNGLLEILSEEIGYYRSTGDSKKGLRAVDDALSLLDCVDTCNSVANATIYLNCATTMKAFGKVEESLGYYDKAKEVYERLLPSDDFRLAGFYNNYAAAMSELKRYKEARDNYNKAIELLKSKGGYGELAVSYVNLAQTVYDEAEASGAQADDTGVETEIDSLLDLAYKCLDDENLPRDGHYASICRKCATAYGFFGYFLQKQDLEERARKIYAQ
ncbi:MAG: tetratricopeptide repeat protein [Clostridia bacterium]|nr:tetratricopeptide repeat protein [Clostridia bacterium]